MKILLYGNGAAENHGCEAIVRGISELLDSPSIVVMSEDKEQDEKYGLNSVGEIVDAREPIKHDLDFFRAYLNLKIWKNFSGMDLLPYKSSIRKYSSDCDLAFSIGGDNYCYGNHRLYAGLNRMYRKQGVKTALWGCSIEPEVVQKTEVAEDLRNYKLVVARESITYEAVKQVQKNTVLIPDPAFYMSPEPCSLPDCFQNGSVVGINVSPMIVSNECQSGITMENYRYLIRKILETTEDSIALIPHVVWKSNDDRSTLYALYESFKDTNRVFLIEDHSAPEMKYLISKCKAFVGARTHATIAAYSSCVPTLVVGYSVKARGIARDLFGQEDGYVIPVQSLSKIDDLYNSYLNLQKNELEIKNRLKTYIPVYKQEGKNVVKELLKDLRTDC